MTDVQRLGELQDLVATEALALVVELWPKPGSATVHVETHQWDRLRRTLLAAAELGVSR